ncbi:hypothetical protein [Sporohalobacter salinus]|uniref:hypothetical protein n=1 Tax=Sporohalobacter salinus TaxID=1494606 RepID=UPI00195F977D|nr:hypothetical protein [Sporohalobacter salinus]MBM7624917.1 Skp family chaperone for outer membrane proteins [Sporohalobacter salinus]
MNQIKDKSKGILDGLNEINEMEENQKNKRKKEEKTTKTKNNKNTKSNQDESKIIKKKRSFMLKENQIEKLYMMKAKDRNKTLSEIVGKAIDLFYEKNF